MITIAQIVVSVLLIVLILFQERGAGLSSAFGGSGEGTPYHTRRGLEKSVFIATIVLAVVFAALAILNLVLST